MNPSLTPPPTASVPTADAEVISTDPKSILCVGAGWFPTAPGGLERYVYELSHHLAQDHNQVELCGVGLPEPPSPLPSPIQLTNLGSPTAPLPQRLWSVRQRFAQRPDHPPDAINLHFALYSLPLLHQLPSGIPVTFTFHGPWALESQQESSNPLSFWFKSWMEHRVYQRCDRFIVLSQAFRDILHQTYRIPPERIHVIPGGVDLNRFQPSQSRPDARQQLGWPTDRFILFTPRRLVQRMGLSQLIAALALLKPQFSEIWLAIAGRGALRPTLEQQVAELGLGEQVRFLGFLPDADLPVAYQAADLTIMPSQSLEGFGLVIAESLACGTPALCTPIGGMPEVIRALTPDLITDDCTAQSIADRLASGLRGEWTLPSQAACRGYAATHLNWQPIARQVKSVLCHPL